MMEEESGQLLRAALPEQWVIHGYTPDYGIDGSVEIFEYTDNSRQCAETLGETFFFQLKSTESCDATEIEVPARGNVEKSPYRPVLDDLTTMEVIRYDFKDTDELLTIETMGAGIVVVLFLACLDTGRVFFVNLTDLIDKVLTPESPDWRRQGSKVIHVPVLNEITADAPVLMLLRFYGLRPKLMGLFAKVHFQWAELEYGQAELSVQQFHAMALHFIEKLLPFDVWDYAGWDLLRHYKEQLLRMRGLLTERGPSEEARGACLDFWFRLDAIGRTFEDVTREWGLPTVLGRLSSYRRPDRD
ncbi:MAG: DUF4365 domain-containing protein [Actinomycetota bacterium]|nr:DUF4365 domain-containing protein [Actinomycetota bacterium]